MAKTFLKSALAPGKVDDAWVGMVAQYVPEGLSQTFIAGAPLKMKSGRGYLIENDNPALAIVAFALEAGSNDASDGLSQVKVLPCFPGTHVYGNFLGASGADNVLAAVDLFENLRLTYHATQSATSGPIWFIEDNTASSEAVKMVSFYADSPVVNNDSTIAVAGDTNARVTAAVLLIECGWTE
jgi:hypothetical protein